MKKLMLIGCMLLASVAMFAQKGTMGVGLNLNYGLHSDFKNLGVGAKYQYEFIDHLRGEASFNYYFKKDYTTQWDMDINLHYVFRPGSSGIGIYPLVGLGFLHTAVDVYGITASSTDLGLNLGAGAEYPITDHIKLNAEFKYQIVSDWNRPVIGIGATYVF